MADVVVNSTPLGWIDVRDCALEPSILSLIPARLHAGEVECIMLARELGASYILLDDNAAKKTAKYLGFSVMGTLGVLVAAKRAGLLDGIEPALADLRHIGFYVSDRVLDMTRDAAGEKTRGG